jgi:hypothetical protein
MTDTYCYKVSSPLVSPEAPHLRSSFARPEDRCGPVGVDVWIPDFFNCASSHWVTMCCLWWLISKPPLRSGRPPFDANKLEPLMPPCWCQTLCRALCHQVSPFPSHRPCVVDPRVHEAGVSLLYALCRRTRRNTARAFDYTVQFVKKFKAEEGYDKRIGAVGSVLANARSLLVRRPSRYEPSR